MDIFHNDSSLDRDISRRSPSDLKRSAHPFSAAILASALHVLNGCGAYEEDLHETDETAEIQQPLLASYTGLSTPAQRTFNKTANSRYTVCLNPTVGNPNLYGHYTGYPTQATYQFASTKLSGSDCIWFSASSSGTYYLGIYNAPMEFPGKTNMWISNSTQNSVPSGFSKALTWPMPGYTSLSHTNANAGAHNFSEFNSPWGNAVSGNNPFFPGHMNYIHSGVDVYAPPATPVKAACDGKIVKLGSLGTDPSTGKAWGYYVGQECVKAGTTLSIAYNHLNNAGRPSLNSTVKAGSALGTVFDMNVSGERDHLHLGICQGTYATCSPQGGALEKSIFPKGHINPWIITNPGLYK